MHIEYLKYFYEVASVKSISKIANSSHISQPALSQQIQKLEDSMGHKLLERSNKGVELTEAGKIVEKYARIIIKAYDNIIEDLSNMGDCNTIRILASPSVAAYALPCTVYMVKEQFANYKINLSSEVTSEIEQNVLNDICQIGFIHGKPSDSSLVYDKVGSDRLVPIASHELNLKEVMEIKDLVKQPLIMMTDKFEERKILNSYMLKKGFNFENCNVVFNLDSIESVKAAVTKGYGISIVPYISVKKELYSKQLKEIAVPDFKLYYDIYIIYKKEMDACRGSRALIQYIKKVGEKSFC
jgi:DNA-binding transcriptional LysR family regulator